ncbi:MAG: hypothetical protein KDA63_19325, partial [Planctomycetales bacterium]|nr:hypothetical protein [Planctomycetales bacterium]
PLIVACVILLAGPVLGLDLKGLPDWAAPPGSSKGRKAMDEKVLEIAPKPSSEKELSAVFPVNLLVSRLGFCEDIGSAPAPRPDVTSA